MPDFHPTASFPKATRFVQASACLALPVTTAVILLVGTIQNAIQGMNGLVALAILIIGAAAVPAPAAPASLCMPQETAVFACPAGQKLISVCASADAASGAGHLQYRFGKDSVTIPASAARGDGLAFSGGGAAWLRLHHDALAYVVYTGIGKWGPKGQTRTKQGLVIERDGKAVTSVKCSGKVTSLLGPDWFRKIGVRANGEDFDLPE